MNEQGTAWKSLRGVSSPGALEPRRIMGLFVYDPRCEPHRQKKKVVTTISGKLIANKQKSMIHENPMQTS